MKVITPMKFIRELLHRNGNRAVLLLILEIIGIAAFLAYVTSK